MIGVKTITVGESLNSEYSKGSWGFRAQGVEGLLDGKLIRGDMEDRGILAKWTNRSLSEPGRPRTRPKAKAYQKRARKSLLKFGQGEGPCQWGDHELKIRLKKEDVVSWRQAKNRMAKSMEWNDMIWGKGDQALSMSILAPGSYVWVII